MRAEKIVIDKIAVYRSAVDKRVFEEMAVGQIVEVTMLFDERAVCHMT